MRRLFIGILLSCIVFTARAEPQPACNHLPFDQQKISSVVLQTIAARCDLPELVKLYNNRMQIYKLMAEYNYLNQAVSADKTSHAYYQTYRILLGLAEAFTLEALTHGDLSAVTHLNKAYRQYIEITELRLRGYDLIANHLEQGLQ